MTDAPKLPTPTHIFFTSSAVILGLTRKKGENASCLHREKYGILSLGKFYRIANVIV